VYIRRKIGAIKYYFKSISVEMTAALY